MHIKWRDDVIHSHKQEMGDIVALASDIIGVLTVVCWKRSCRVGDQRNGKVVFHAILLQILESCAPPLRKNVPMMAA